MLRIAIELPVDVAVVENPIKGFSKRRLKAAFFNLKIFKKELPKSKFRAALFAFLPAEKPQKRGESGVRFQIYTLLYVYAQKTAENLSFQRTFFKNDLVNFTVLYYTII